MGKPKSHPPSRVDSLPFPVFGLTWHGSPIYARPPGGGGGGGGRDGGCSVVAYCGGGGSGRHGVGNAIVVVVVVVAPIDDGGDRSTTTTVRTRRVEISTGESTCFHVHAYRRHYDDDGGRGAIGVLACVGDEVILYGISLLVGEGRGGSDDDDDGVDGGKRGGGDDDGGEGRRGKEEASILARASVGKSRGANVATFASRFLDGKLIHLVAVGCEDGTVVVFRLIDGRRGEEDGDEGNAGPSSTTHEFVEVVECTGHEKAVCSVNFHPRGTHVLTSAKDGTARVFSVDDGAEVALLRCEVHDPRGPAPHPPTTTTTKPSSSGKTSTDPRMMKRPPQVIVRGSFYGDLEGRTIYTVASGKRGPTYLSRWAPSSSSPPPSSFEQVYRVQCSPVPISSTSMSSDGTILTLGSVEGSVLLYNLETKSVMREFREVHDMPVTCVASRPVPTELMLPGEMEGGVNFDALSASADNKLGMWTLQKRSRISTPVPPRIARERGALEAYAMRMARVPLLVLLALAIVAIQDAIDVCGEAFGATALMADGGMSTAGRCLFREVLWAEEARVSFVPE